MKAIVLTAYGDTDKLELRHLPDPKAPPGGIVVRVAAASINPIDLKIRSGAAASMFPVQFPAVLGSDASGEVIEVGEGVNAFAVGDRVLGYVQHAYAERVAGAAECWAKLPAGLDLIDAGALGLVLVTGAELMEEATDAQSGEAILVTGALGGVGRTALYAAQLRGAKVWAGVRGSQKGEAKSLGADGVVALDDPSDLAKLPRLDRIADTLGGETIQKLYAALKPGGTIGSVVGPSPGAKEKGFVVKSMSARPNSARLAKYATAVAEGKFTIPIARKYPLAEAAAAQKFAETQRPQGKVLLLG